MVVIFLLKKHYNLVDKVVQRKVNGEKVRKLKVKGLRNRITKITLTGVENQEVVKMGWDDIEIYE